MVAILIGIILILTSIIVLLCVKIRMAQTAHDLAANHFRELISRLEGEHASNVERLAVSDALRDSILNARREMDHLLIDAVSAKKS